ncbi:MAG: MATE family efflux transporter [Lachnospiraceae bacterium]|nr:MATE family efflux transporter [Lachnospiraceae bacterium]
MLSNVLQVLFNMADVAVVGQFAGSAALGSVGSTATLVALFTGILIGMSCGVNVLVALHYGAKKPKEVMETVHTSALVCLTLGVLLTITGVIYARDILQLLNTKEELIEGAAKYLRIYFMGMPALALYNFGNGVYSAVGETRMPLVYLTIAGVVNVILNLILVIGFHMDVAGVAIASVISQYISAVLILLSLLKVKDIYGLDFRKLRFHRDKVQSILTIGIPSSLQYAIFQVANLFVQVGVNSFDAVMVEGNSAAANADALVYDVMAAFYTACSSFMSQNYGAGKKDRVLKSFLISLAYSFGIGTLMGLALVVFGENFLALFTKDALVIEAGMKRLTIMGLSYGVSAFMDASIAACRGLGKSVIPTFIVIMGSCVFRVIWVYTVFAHFQTIPSLYLLYIFSWTITAVAELIYFIVTYRKQMKILQ